MDKQIEMKFDYNQNKKILCWTQEQIDWLIKNYPEKGKMFCAEYLQRSKSSIRWKASHLKLRQNINSEFFNDWQYRAMKSKEGILRPEHSKLMSEYAKQGRLAITKPRTELQKEEVGKRMRKWHKEHQHPKGMLGKTHTEETIKKLSKISKENFEKLSPLMREDRIEKTLKTRMKNGNWNNHLKSSNPYSRTVSGKRKDLDNMFFRSKTEANYARFLKMQGLVFEFEKKEFFFEKIKRGTRSYMPDFYIPSLDQYHEVKGWLDAKSITKLKRFRIFYPSEFDKLFIIKQGLSKKNLLELIKIGFDPKQIVNFREIEKISSKIIGWEF